MRLNLSFSSLHSKSDFLPRTSFYSLVETIERLDRNSMPSSPYRRDSTLSSGVEWLEEESCWKKGVSLGGSRGTHPFLKKGFHWWSTIKAGTGSIRFQEIWTTLCFSKTFLVLTWETCYWRFPSKGVVGPTICARCVTGMRMKEDAASSNATRLREDRAQMTGQLSGLFHDWKKMVSGFHVLNRRPA